METDALLWGRWDVAMKTTSLHTLQSSPMDPIYTHDKFWAVGRLTLPGCPGGSSQAQLPSLAGAVTQTGLAHKQALPRRSVGRKDRNSF